MAYVTREQAIGALFELLMTLGPDGSNAFNVVSRRLKIFSDVATGEQPALYLYEKDETHKRQNPASMVMRQLEADIIIYINVGMDPTVIPAKLMNNLLDLIDPASGGVLLADNLVENRQTLGGLVYDCWIEGGVKKVPGDMDGQGISVLPVRILLP